MYKDLVAFDFEIGQYLTGEAAARLLLREYRFLDTETLATALELSGDSVADFGSFQDALD